MQKFAKQVLATAAVLALAAPAQAMTFQIGLQITSATGGNPLGAVVGTASNAGTGDIGSQVVTGVGFEFPSMNPAFDAGASMSLTIGTITFGHEDDIESAGFNDIPALVLQNGVLVGLDFVSLFSISGSDAVGVTFDESDIGQDTSGLTSGNHYWADFFDDGSFFVSGPITGFDVIFDEEEQMNVLVPVAPTFITGNVVPEPALALLAGSGLLGLALLRRR